MKLRFTAAILFVCVMLFPAHAQSINVDLNQMGQTGATSRLIQLTAMITVLSLAPSLLVMITAFTRIVIVLSLLRSAIGAQGTPPNMVMIGLALFLTFFVMEPTLNDAWNNGLLPLSQGKIGDIDGLARAALPFHRFMTANLRSADLDLFLKLGRVAPSSHLDDTPWRVLVPGFIVGELRRAFEMGFLLYLPFLVIDAVVASILMSLGMMMLPPATVSLPFKLIFFVMIDGWRLVAGSLVQSFAPH